MSTTQEINMNEVESFSNIFLTRQEAKEKGCELYFPTKPCENGHMSMRRTNESNTCVECERVSHKKAKHDQTAQEQEECNDKKKKAAQRAIDYYYNNKDKILEQRKEYYLKHRDKLMKYQKEYRKKNPDKVRNNYNEYANTHKTERARYQKEYYRRRNEEWQMAFKIQTPKWANKKAMERNRVLAETQSKNTGKRIDVDYIVPLLGPKFTKAELKEFGVTVKGVRKVSGLNCEQNMRLNSNPSDFRKRNKFDPMTYVHEMPKK
jgi:hypothetical protein